MARRPYLGPGHRRASILAKLLREVRLTPSELFEAHGVRFVHVLLELPEGARTREPHREASTPAHRKAARPPTRTLRRRRRASESAVTFRFFASGSDS